MKITKSCTVSSTLDKSNASKHPSSAKHLYIYIVISIAVDSHSCFSLLWERCRRGREGVLRVARTLMGVGDPLTADSRTSGVEIRWWFFNDVQCLHILDSGVERIGANSLFCTLIPVHVVVLSVSFHGYPGLMTKASKFQWITVVWHQIRIALKDYR